MTDEAGEGCYRLARLRDAGYDLERNRGCGCESEASLAPLAVLATCVAVFTALAGDNSAPGERDRDQPFIFVSRNLKNASGE